MNNLFKHKKGRQTDGETNTNQQPNETPKPSLLIANEIGALPVSNPFLGVSQKTVIGDFTFEMPLADLMLSKYNPRNRPEREGRTERYVSDMKANRWNDNAPNEIHIDKNGNLLNGQHRLKAALKTGRPYRSTVMYGLDPRVVNFIDEASRTAVERWLLSGDQPINKTSKRRKGAEFAIARLWLWSESGCKQTPGKSELELMEFIALKQQPISSVLNTALHNPDAKLAACRTVSAQYIERHPVQGTEFWKGIAGDGSNLSTGSAILKVRDYLAELEKYGMGGQHEAYKTILFLAHKFHCGENVTRIRTAEAKKQKTWDI